MEKAGLTVEQAAAIPNGSLTTEPPFVAHPFGLLSLLGACPFFLAAYTTCELLPLFCVPLYLHSASRGHPDVPGF